MVVLIRLLRARSAGARRMLAAALALTVPLAPLSADAQAGPVEYAVKATYIYKFAPFVEWPSAAFPSTSAPLSICVMRAGELLGVLERAVSGQKLGDRPIVVRSVDRLEADRACHILYVGSLDGETRAETLAGARGAPTLTITDGATDPAAKGIINFVIDKNRVRFEIDDFSAAENGLVISSKLLRLAVSVRPRA
jgi:hypothetical protein